MPSGDVRPELSPEIERLLTEVNVLRARNQTEQALERASQAAELDPQAWPCWEVIGDLEHERAQFEAALAAYERAREINPERAALEEKIGVVLLQQEEWNRKIERARYLEEHPQERVRLEKEMRRPAVAGLLSGLAPGLGQVYNRQTEKGVLMLAAHIVLVSVVIGVLLQVAETLRVMASDPYQDGGFLDALRAQSVGSLFALLLCLTLIAGLVVYAVLEAVLQAAKINRVLEEGDLLE